MTTSRPTFPAGWYSVGSLLTAVVLVLVLAILMAVGVIPFTPVWVGVLLALLAIARFC
jgi:hypothetical protein